MSRTSEANASRHRQYLYGGVGHRDYHPICSIHYDFLIWQRPAVICMECNDKGMETRRWDDRVAMYLAASYLTYMSLIRGSLDDWSLWCTRQPAGGYRLR